VGGEPSTTHEWPLTNEYLDLLHGIPPHDTIRRVLALLKRSAFQRCFQQWIASLRDPGVATEDADTPRRPEHTAIDGKAVRRAHDDKLALDPLFLVSAWSVQRGISLAQLATAEKLNEITAIPEMIDRKNWKDCGRSESPFVPAGRWLFDNLMKFEESGDAFSRQFRLCSIGVRCSYCKGRHKQPKECSMAGDTIIRHQAERNEGHHEFDYDQLVASMRQAVREETEMIRGLLAKTAANIVQIGLRLQFVRNRLGREHFQDWLRAEFRWSQSVASNYMQAARVFGDTECLQQFQPGALYVLARKKAPSEARSEALARARQGELITKARAEVILAKHSSTPPAVRTRVHDKVRRYLENVLRGLPREELEDVADELLQFARELKEAKSPPETQPNE
jgi:hypothetical protein